jgi:hypothetical protein
MDNTSLPISISIIVFGVVLGLFIFAGLVTSALIIGAQL